ncbi:hypothetical protein OPQ81_010651 [Rhizoctonia solani]|nr:hypothetical protein OPQ81_010651 [Rhizoctonia solani]
MGRSLGHESCPNPAPQKLLDSAPNISTDENPLLSSSTETSTSAVLYERHRRRNGSLGHPTRSEASTRTSDSISGTPPSSTLLPDVADVPNQALDDPFPSHYEPIVDMVSPPRLVPTPQSSKLVSSLLVPVSSSPMGVFSTRSVFGPAPNPKEFPNSAVQARPKPPRVKVCLLCTGGRDIPVLEDTSLIMQALARVRNIDPDHIVTRTSKMIDFAFDRFFDPTDIRKGGLLILIISCHGKRGLGDDVSLPFQIQDGTLVNSRILQEKIMALPKHCTLEVVMDTCFAEGVIPGLRRVSDVEPLSRCAMTAGVTDRSATHTPSGQIFSDVFFCVSEKESFQAHTSVPRILCPAKHLMLKRTPLYSLQEYQSQYKAHVVVWAASTRWGVSYPEADLPGKPGVYSIMIGAIFNHLISNGPNISRQSVWESVLKAVEQQNEARRERDLLKPPEVQTNLGRENRIQRPTLLTSMEDPDHVLGGFVFQPIKRRSTEISSS